MKRLFCVLSTLAVAGMAPSVASAADLGRGYVERDTIIEEAPPVVERERIIERRYYEPDYYYYDGPVVTYYEPRWRHRWHRHHWRHGW
jgi:hypothetical protein